MIFKCIVVITLLATVGTVWARSASTNLNDVSQEQARSSESPTSYLSDLRYVYKVYQECAATDLSPCLKLKLVAAMDRALRSYNEVPLIEGVTFVKDPKTLVDTNPTTEAELDAVLPRTHSDREDALNLMISEKVVNFFDTHSLQIKLPTATDIQRSFNGEEGRGKKNKRMGMLIPFVLAGTLIPIALGALAILAGKALIVSKIALVLAAIIALKKLVGGGGHSGGLHESQHEVVVSGNSHAGASGWGRSFNEQEAQKIVYSAHVPKTTR